MLTCESCQTTLYLQNERVLNAGSSGEMHDVPLLFGLGDRVRLGKNRLEVLGHARFSYGRGFWDEFWGIDKRGDGLWVSVDEGDVVVQYPVPENAVPDIAKSSSIGREFVYRGKTFRVTERNAATCVAVRGTFDERLLVGETYDFLNLEGPDGMLLSGEFWSDGEGWFVGAWHDPFDVETGVTL